MTDVVTTAIISSLSGIISGVLGIRGVEHMKLRRHANGNGNSAAQTIAQRDDLRFQTEMTLLMGQLTAAIEKGHDKAIEKMGLVAVAIADAASAIKEVHEEIVQHRADTRPAIEAAYETGRRVQRIESQLEKTAA